MAGTVKKREKTRWYRDYKVPFPDMEIVAKGLLLPGRHALYEFYDDFVGFTVAASGVSGWHQDADGTPTDAAIQDEAFGVMLTKPGSTATNNVHYHWATNTTVHEIFKMAVGKRMWLATRLYIEDADQNYINAGCHVSQDDPWNTEPSDTFWFRTPPATLGDIEFAVGKANNAEVTISLGTLADATYVRLLAFYDGADTCWAWRYDDNGLITNSGHVSVTSSSQGDLLPDTEMSVAFGCEAADTGADDYKIDFLYVAMER